jgi:hypothetical protein
MFRFRRHAVVAALASAVLLAGALVAPAGAAVKAMRSLTCLSTTSQGSGPFTGRLRVGPPGLTFATYIRTTVTNVNLLGWWGTVTVNGQVSQTMWLAPFYLPGNSRTISGPTIIGQEYVNFRIDIDPISDPTQVGIQVCA